MNEVTEETLFELIGRLWVRNQLLTRERAVLAAELKRLKEAREASDA